jgi:hypothetical protein
VECKRKSEGSKSSVENVGNDVLIVVKVVDE